MEPGSEATIRLRLAIVRIAVSGILVPLAGALAGCGADPTPARPLPGPNSLRIADAGVRELQLEAAPDVPVLITVTAQDVDVKAGVSTGPAATSAFCDAPNRRMGIETLLVDAPHEPVITIRVERNDHSGALGAAEIGAELIPVATDADRLRLEAARNDAAGCRAHADPASREDPAAAFLAAADLWTEVGDLRRRGLALLHAAGARYQRQSDWQAAAELAGRASTLLDRANVPVQAAFALRLQGAALDQLANASNFDLERRDGTAHRARQLLTRSASRFDELAMPFEAGYALSYRGVSFSSAGDAARGRADFQEALGRFAAAGDKPAQALALQSLAGMSHEDGRSADAAREFEAALALIPRDEDAANYAHTLHNSALPLRVLGRFDEAMARHHEAARILRGLGDRDGEARALHSLALVRLYTGEPDAAAELLRAAIRLRGETGARREQAIALLNLGSIERDAGRVEEAIALDQQALALVSTPHDRARALVSLARDHLASGNRGHGRERLEEVLRLPLPESQRYLGFALAELAALESEDGRAARSEEYFARALAVHEASGSDLDHARALYGRARARLARGDQAGALSDSAAALRDFDEIGVQALHAEARAAFRASYRDVVELRIAALLRAAGTAGRTGNPVASRRNVRHALDVSDRARAQLLAESTASRAAVAAQGLQAERRQVYALLAGKRQQQDRLLDSVAPDAERIAGLAREIGLLRTRSRLIEGRIAQEEAAASGAGPQAPVELATVVPAGVLAVEYFLGRRQSWLFEVRDGEVRVHTLGPGDELEALARELHQSWQQLPALPGNRLAAARRLSRLLLGPVTDAVSAQEVWIVPDRALHVVPMALLARQIWPEMRAAAAVIKPSLATLREVGAMGTAAVHPLAVIADPVYESQDPRVRLLPAGPAPLPADDAFAAGHAAMLRRLPATAVEARELMALVDDPGGTLALLGPQASRTNVIAAPLDRYRIVHFAAHALADSRDPALASIELSRFAADGRPLQGTLRQYDIAQLRLDADLVVLSGCDSGLGREIVGEGPIGLSHAFLRSGARAVVATLWQVPDSSTAVLMRAFYREMFKQGRAPPDALALAQDHLRRQPRWSDPYYWAGFQLVSNARATFGTNSNVTGREES